MDVEPIYCAEQIVVPSDLAGVLKAFTKEFIRSQPSNVIQFSAEYFANLAAQASSLHAVSPPSRQQLHQAYAQLQDTPTAPLADVNIACQAAGISDDTLQRVVAAGRIDTSKAVRVLEVLLLLLLTMSCETFAGTVQGIFEVFGSSSSNSSRDNVLPVADFLALLGHLAAYDSDVSAALQQQVAEALSGQLDTDYKGLLAIPALADKLA
uniref:RIIa domain-containing protein n=1 Tax=Tetradesmus obliquus TaxID=3088 RepID=A0A383VWU6_TETOB|eukprot:jgi/Sobl393_1/6908/SZX69329.1